MDSLGISAVLQDWMSPHAIVPCHDFVLHHCTSHYRGRLERHAFNMLLKFAQVIC